MSFKACYENCLVKNNLKLLVIKTGVKDTLIGYRLYQYDPVKNVQCVYDFAIDGDEIKSLPNGSLLFDFLSEMTPKLQRICMIEDGNGGYTTKAELASKYTVMEIRGVDIVEPLVQVIKSYVLSGMYSLKNCKNI